MKKDLIIITIIMFIVVIFGYVIVYHRDIPIPISETDDRPIEDENGWVGDSLFFVLPDSIGGYKCPD